MLFNVNDNTNYFNDYLSNNIDNSNNNVLTPKEGLMLGNLFANEYDKYKNYQPNALTSSSEQGRDLLKIRELSFAVLDLNLKLDIEPNNQELFRLFKLYNEELNKRLKEYSDKYESLEISYDLNNKYSWLDNPWPWEVDNNV